MDHGVSVVVADNHGYSADGSGWMLLLIGLISDVFRMMDAVVRA